jgi:hypothetical protein
VADWGVVVPVVGLGPGLHYLERGTWGRVEAAGLVEGGGAWEEPRERVEREA